MGLFNSGGPATKVYIGTTNATAVYLGATKVWPAAPASKIKAIKQGVAAGDLLPKHAPGDLLLMFVADQANQVVLVPPAAGGGTPNWIPFGTPPTGRFCEAWGGYAVATASNHMSGSWPTPGAFTCVVMEPGFSTPHAAMLTGESYTGRAGVVDPFPIPVPALTASNTSGSSVVLSNIAMMCDSPAGKWMDTTPPGYKSLYEFAGNGGLGELSYSLMQLIDTKVSPAQFNRLYKLGDSTTSWASYTVEVPYP
jgi:hypothetical protein